MKRTTQSPGNLIISLVAVGVVPLLLLIARVYTTDSGRFVFLLWNLVLASIAPLIAWWLVVRIRKFGWLHWKQILITILWLAFLPNSFYLITDLVHLQYNYEASLIYDTVLLQSFILAGLIYGYLSVFLVHKEVEKRFSVFYSWSIISGVFLASSFAIYLGRFTRWNTWDILLKPAGLLFDVSDRFVNPGEHGDTYVTTFTFVTVLLATYVVIWHASKLLSNSHKS